MLLATVDVPGIGRWKERTKHWQLLSCDVCNKSFLRKSLRRTNSDLCSTRCKTIAHRKPNLKRRVPIDEVKAHGFDVMIDESTYAGTTKKARFLDCEHGVWWAQVKSVIQGRRHTVNKYGKRLLSRTEVDNRLNLVHDAHVSIAPGEIYVNSHKRMRFVDDEFGEWEAMPYSVLAGHGHPKRGFQNAMRKMRSTTIKLHWKTGAEIVCVGSYEAAAVNWLNAQMIDFDWQVPFESFDDKTYYVDLFIKEGCHANTYVEIKGHWMQEISLLKWQHFKKFHSNAELWDLQRLKKLGIL